MACFVLGSPGALGSGSLLTSVLRGLLFDLRMVPGSLVRGSVSWPPLGELRCKK